ncbi:molybdenum cofactor biosynthesis protein MoaE [bacterium]|nr:molybdenum cofactor biosynthesis protein MoaE [bacterium]
MATPRFLITAEPLALEPLLAAVAAAEHGAVVGFLGVVRAEAGLAALDYEAYAPMAERQMAAIAAELGARWGPLALAAHHRVGRLAVGTPSLALAVGAPHRAAAFAAAAAFVDRLKEVVPIWKSAVPPGGAGEEPR